MQQTNTPPLSKARRLPMAKRVGRSRKAELEIDPREARFREFYDQGLSAKQAALRAGYSAPMAHSKSYLLAQRVKRTVAERLIARGCDADSQAGKLIALREAGAVKWNTKKERWDQFQDNDVQLRATQDINRILDAYPAPKEPTDTRPVTIIFPSSFANLAKAKS
jgi:hypothetical protein